MHAVNDVCVTTRPSLLHQPLPLGTDQRFKRLNVDGVSVGVSVWDTAGQERFQSLTSMFFRGAQGVVYGAFSATCNACSLAPDQHAFAAACATGS